MGKKTTTEDILVQIDEDLKDPLYERHPELRKNLEDIRDRILSEEPTVPDGRAID